MKKPAKLMHMLLLLAISLAACQPPETPAAGEPPTPAPADTPIPADTPAPPPPTTIPIPDTLVVCLQREPDSLYLYNNPDGSAQHIWQAIYDGPIDNIGYQYEPVILEKLPNLLDGDASIQTITVNEGDLVVDYDGNVKKLTPGVHVRRSGCSEGDCAQEYSGGELQLDQLQATYRLQRGILWSDGEPLTAEDSVYSFELNADPATPGSKYAVERTQSYTAQDDLTVTWTGLPGFMDPNYALNFWSPAPRHQWEGISAAQLLSDPKSSQKPLGWGPYVIDTWNPGQMILSKNPNYFRRNQGLPKFEQLVIQFVGSNGNNNVAAVMSGECDILESVEDVDFVTLQELTITQRIKAVFGQKSTWEHIDFGINPAAYDDGYDPGDGDRPAIFDDKRTRQGIAFCLDRQQVMEQVTFGLSEVMNSYLPSQHPLYNFGSAQYGYSPADGIAFLEAAGWVLGEDGKRQSQEVANLPNGTPLVVNYLAMDTTRNRQILAILNSSAQVCGFELLLDLIPPEIYYLQGPEGRLFGRQFDLAQFTWRADNVPDCRSWTSAAIPGDAKMTIGEIHWLRKNLGSGADLEEAAFPYGWNGWNVSGYASAQFDAACREAQQNLPGQAGFAEKHSLVQQLFSEELPILPLFPHIQMAATRIDLCGFNLDPSAVSSLWNIEEYGIGILCP